MGVKSLSGSGNEQQVQRPCGRYKLDRSKEQKEGQCDWKITSDRSLADEITDIGRGQVIVTLSVTVRSWAYILRVMAVGSQWRDLSWGVL